MASGPITSWEIDGETGLARRFFPETVLKQETLLLYNPKECRGKKKFVFSSSLRIPDPSLLGDPWTSYQPAQELTLSIAWVI